MYRTVRYHYCFILFDFILFYSILFYFILFVPCFKGKVSCCIWSIEIEVQFCNSFICFISLRPHPLYPLSFTPSPFPFSLPPTLPLTPIPSLPSPFAPLNLSLILFFTPIFLPILFFFLQSFLQILSPRTRSSSFSSSPCNFSVSFVSWLDWWIWWEQLHWPIWAGCVGRNGRMR